MLATSQGSIQLRSLAGLWLLFISSKGVARLRVLKKSFLWLDILTSVRDNILGTVALISFGDDNKTGKDEKGVK